MEVDIEKAVDEGIISLEQAQKLEQMMPAEGPEHSHDDDEKIGIVKGYNDIFFSIGIILATLGAGFLAPYNIVGIVILLLGWGMAEMLRGKYRSVLPMIVTSIIVALGASLSWAPTETIKLTGDYMFVKSIFALVAMLAFYWRFKVPFTLAMLCFSAATTLYFLIVTPWMFGPLVTDEYLEIFTRMYLVVAGVVFFIAAMRLDASDVQRQTRRADCAFWLHILASASILHGALSGFLGGSSLFSTIVTAVVLLLVLLVSLAIDRRSPIVSCLLYVGAAVYYLADNFAVTSDGNVIAITMLILGVMVFVVGIYWHALRGTLFASFASSRLFAKLPPIKR